MNTKVMFLLLFVLCSSPVCFGSVYSETDRNSWQQKMSYFVG